MVRNRKRNEVSGEWSDLPTGQTPCYHHPDPRVPIIANMAARIFCEKLVYHDNKDARRMAVNEAFALYGEIVIRLAENDK